MQFDARRAKLLAAGDHMTIDGAPGLRIVRSQSGWAWVYRYKSPIDSRMRQVRLGAWPALSASQAGVEWERLRTAREQGQDPAQDRRAARAAVVTAAKPAAGRLTVQRLADDFAELHAKSRRAPKGYAELTRTFRTMLGPVAHLAPEAVTRSIAYDLISSYASRPVQAATLRRELGAAWEWGHDSGRLPESVPNWWRQVLRGKLPSAGKIVGGDHQGVVKRALSLAEVGAILRHLPHISRLNADLLTLYLWTGCRGAEIVAMEGREVAESPDGWWWTIPRGKLKMRRHPLTVDLRVPLVGRALAIVRGRLDVYGPGYLFPARGAVPHTQQKVVGVCVWWHMPECMLRPEETRLRWPVSAWAPHDLRRTVRTQLAVMGCPTDVAESVLGHLQPGIEGVYNRHGYDAERRLWLTRLSETWEAAAVR